MRRDITNELKELRLHGMASSWLDLTAQGESGTAASKWLIELVFCKGSMDAMEPTLVHELAHALVAHLPMPAWVNEGLAVNTERRWAPRPPQFQPHELAKKHSRFWNDETMQQFWSGKSYLRTDDGNLLRHFWRENCLIKMHLLKFNLIMHQFRSKYRNSN